MSQHRFRQAWRLSLLGAFLTTVLCFIYYQFSGNLPVVNTFKLYSWYTFSLPIQLSRWWDILIVPIHVILLVVIWGLNNDKVFFFKERLIRNDQGLVQGLGRGFVVGLISGLLILLSWQFNFVYLLSLNIALVIYSFWNHLDMNIVESKSKAKNFFHSWFILFIFGLVFTCGNTLLVSLCKGLVVGILFAQVFSFIIFLCAILLLLLFAVILSFVGLDYSDKIREIKYNFQRKVELAIYHKKPWARFIYWLLDS